MIIHASEDVIYSSPYSRQAYDTQESPEVLLLKRLVWVRFQSYWWPALIFQSYTELQEFLADELDTMTKAQLTMAIMRQMQERRNIKVARLLGKKNLEIVEVTTKYYDFYSKLPQLLPKAIDRSRYGRDTEQFLDIHRALDQVEVIISEVSEKPFSLLPGMGCTTWLQKARAQVTKRDNLMDQGNCNYFPELRDQTRGDTSISPIAQQRPMSHLVPSTDRQVPSHIQSPNNHGDYHHRGVTNQDFLLSQYQAISRLANHDPSDVQSAGSMLSTGVLAPHRDTSGKAVRFSKNTSSATTPPTHSKRNLEKKQSSNDMRMRQPMPSIKEGGGTETRDEIGTRDPNRKVPESRETPTMKPKSEEVRSLRKIGHRAVKTPPSFHRNPSGIRRPPMKIARERNRIAVPTESTLDGHARRVQEYLVHKEISEEDVSPIIGTDVYQIMPDTSPVSEDSSSAASSVGSTQDGDVETDAVAKPTSLRDVETAVEKPASLQGVETTVTKQPSLQGVEASVEKPPSYQDVDTAVTKPPSLQGPPKQSSEKESSQPEMDSVAASSMSAFDDYLRETERTLDRLIRLEKERLMVDQRRNNYSSNKHDHQRLGRERNMTERPQPMHQNLKQRNRSRPKYGASMNQHPKQRSRSSHQKQRQKKEPSGFMSCFPGNEDQYEPSVATSYNGGKSIEILPGLEGDDIVPGLSDKINRLMIKKRREARPKKKVPIEILPGLEGDDILPGLSEKVARLVAKKGSFTQQDVLNMIAELELNKSDDEGSISINQFDELARQRVRNILRRK